MAAVKEFATGVIRAAFEPGLNGCRIERVERCLRLAGFLNIEGYEATKEAVELLGFRVCDSFVWEES